MTANEIQSHIEKMIRRWEETYTIAPADYISRHQMSSDVLLLVKKVKDAEYKNKD
jgi:hypothetical protein